MITSQVSSVTYAPNGVTTIFAVTFPFLVNSEVDVFLTIDGVRSEVVSGITFAGAGNPSGGTVTFAVAPVSGSTLLIERNTVAKQEVDYINNDAFEASSNESQMDRLAMAVIDAKRAQVEGLARSLRAPVGESFSELAIAANRAGLFLGFDEDGAPVLKTPDEILALSSGVPDGVGLPAAGTAGHFLKALGGGLGEWEALAQAELEAAIDNPENYRDAIRAKIVANILDYGAVAGTGVSAGVRTANTAAIQAALDTGRDVYIPTGRFEIDAALVWDTDRQSIFGDGAARSVIYQATASEHGITFETSPEASGVTKCGVLRDFSLLIVGGGPTGYGLNAYKAASPNHALIRCRDLFISGFARGVYHEHWDNLNFRNCEFNSNAINVYAGASTASVSYDNCINTNATVRGWEITADGRIKINGGDHGNTPQWVRNAGFCSIDHGNWETVTGAVNGAIECTSLGSLIIDSPSLNGGTSTIPAIYMSLGQLILKGSPSLSGWGSGGGGIFMSSGSGIIHSGLGAGFISNRSAAQLSVSYANAAFKALPPGVFDVVGDTSPSTAVAANRGLFQGRLSRDVANTDDRWGVMIQLADDTFAWEPILNRDTRTTVASAATTVQLVVNTRHRLTHTALQTCPLPTTSKVDDEVEVICVGTGGAEITQATGQFIRQSAAQTTSGVSGKLSLVQGSVCRIKCITANAGWIVIGGNYNATVT